MAGENVVKLTITVDPTNSKEAVVDLGQRLVDLGGKGSSGAKAATDSLLELARASSSVREQMVALGQQVLAMGQQATGFSQTAASVRDLGTAAGGAREILASLGQQVQTVGQQATSIDRATGSVRELGSTAKATTQETQSLLGGLGSVKSLLGTLGVAFAAKELIQSVKDLGVAVFETGRQLESLGLTFKAITGSAEGAQAELAGLRKVAKDLGQDYMVLAQSTKGFLAASKDTELSGSGARDVIRGFSTGVAALGLSSQDAQGVFLALSQMMSKGTVQAEELRGQLGERLPGAFNLSARAMGVTTAELGKMLEQGQVLSTDLVPKLARVLEQEYGQAAKEAANTGTAAVNQMSTAWTDFKSAVADTGAFAAAVKTLKWLADSTTAAANAIRVATGTLQGQAKLQWLNQRIGMLSGPDSTDYADGMVSYHSGQPGDSERQALERERSLLLSDMLESQRGSTSQEQANLVAKAAEKQQAAIMASQKATLEDWGNSPDKVVAAWAKLEIARGKAQAEVLSGKKTQEWMDGHVGLYQDKLAEAQQQAGKKGATAANAAGRADIKGSATLQRIEDDISTYEESLGGNRLGAAIAKIEREHNQALSRIREELVGAKGGVEALHQAEVRLGTLKELKIKTAELADLNRQLDVAAKHESALARDTYGAQGSQLKADWLQGYKQYLQDLQQGGYGTDLADPQRIAEAEERWRAHQQFMLDEDVRRVGEGGKLSDAYWDAEGRKLEASLVQVKKYVTDENAFQVYASQQRSELRRKELEARLGYEEDFIGYLRDYLALELKAYQDDVTRKRAMWQEMAKSTADYIKQIGGDVESGIADVLTNLWEGNAQKARQSWADMWAGMWQDTIRYVVNIASTLAKQYLILPIVAQIVGTDSSGLAGLGINASADQGKASGGSGGIISSLSKYGGMARDGYSYLSSLGASSTSFGGGLGAGTSVAGTAGDYLGATQLSYVNGQIVAGGSGSGVTTVGGASGSTLSGVMGVAGPAAAAGGAGYLAGQFLRPDVPAVGYMGAGFGAATGALAASTTVGSALGLSSGSIGGAVGGALGIGAGLAATGVGALAGLVVAGIMAAATPNTTQSTWSTSPGSKQAVMLVDGELVPASYGVIKSTTSGMMGSSSTSHATIFQSADTAMAAEERTAMTAATAGLTKFSQQLGLTGTDLKKAISGANLQLTAIPDGMADEVWHNLGNLLATTFLDATGLRTEAEQYQQAGEGIIDTLTRISGATESAAQPLAMLGLNLESLAGSASQLAQGDWASQVISAMGGVDQFTSALTRLGKWAYSSAEQQENALQYYARKSNTAIAALGDGGVDLTNFWGQYRARMEAGSLSPDQFKSWANASTWVEQAYTAANTAAQQTIATRQDEIQAMQTQRSELAKTADSWRSASKSMRSFVASMRTDTTYSTLSPAQILAERQTAYQQALARAKTDPTAVSDLQQAAQDLRDYAYQYYGGNAEYVAIEQSIESGITGMADLADAQYQAALDQIARLDAGIAISQQQVSAQTLTNANLGRVAGAVEASGSAIVQALSLMGHVDVKYTPGQADAISAANDAWAGQLAQAGGSSTPATIDWSSLSGAAAGGMVIGGVPGVDSVPVLTMQGEHILSVDHSTMLRRISDGASPTDTTAIERLLAILVATTTQGNRALEKRLAAVEAVMGETASNLSRVVE